MRVFVDTSAFFALLDRDDANHKKAKEIWNKVLNLLIPSFYEDDFHEDMFL